MDQSSSTKEFNVDEEIAQEERWIRIYEAEMALLSFETNQAYENLERTKEKDNHSTTTTTEEDESIWDWFDHVLQANHSFDRIDPAGTVSQLVQQAVIAEQEAMTSTTTTILPIQSIVCGFTFQNVLVHQQLQQQQTFQFRGSFLANPNVQANIYMTIERQLSSSNRSAPLVPKFRVVSMEYQLDDSHWKWLQDQVLKRMDQMEGGTRNDPNDHDPLSRLPQFILLVSEYLEFDAQRKQTLLLSEQQSFPTTTPINHHHHPVCPWFHEQSSRFTVEHMQSRSILTIPIQQKRQRRHHRQPPSTPHDNNHSVLSIVWGWNWIERRDFLKFHYPTLPQNQQQQQQHPHIALLRQRDLEQIVALYNGDCWKALQLIIASCSHCQCWRQKGEMIHTLGNHKHNQKQHNTKPTQYYFESMQEYYMDEASADDEQSMSSYASSLSNLEEKPNRTKPHDPDPFRYSPSGRRLSDYEVQRLERIHRNEQKLMELGLLQKTTSSEKIKPISSSSRSSSTTFPLLNSTTTRRRKQRSKWKPKQQSNQQQSTTDDALLPLTHHCHDDVNDIDGKLPAGTSLANVTNGNSKKKRPATWNQDGDDESYTRMNHYSDADPVTSTSAAVPSLSYAHSDGFQFSSEPSSSGWTATTNLQKKTSFPIRSDGAAANKPFYQMFSSSSSSSDEYDDRTTNWDEK
jgi:hypothetical protein